VCIECVYIPGEREDIKDLTDGREDADDTSEERHHANQRDIGSICHIPAFLSPPSEMAVVMAVVRW
jgi:hypothetical protein